MYLYVIIVIICIMINIYYEATWPKLVNMDISQQDTTGILDVSKHFMFKKDVLRTMYLW